MFLVLVLAASHAAAFALGSPAPEKPRLMRKTSAVTVSATGSSAANRMMRKESDPSELASMGIRLHEHQDPTDATNTQATPDATTESTASTVATKGSTSQMTTEASGGASGDTKGAAEDPDDTTIAESPADTTKDSEA